MKLNIYLNILMDINCLYVYVCLYMYYKCIYLYIYVSFRYSICLNFNRNNKKIIIYILIKMGVF